MEKKVGLPEEPKGKDTERYESTSQNFSAESSIQLITPIQINPSTQLHAISDVKHRSQTLQEVNLKGLMKQTESNNLITSRSQLNLEVQLSSNLKEEVDSFIQDKLNVKQLKRKNTPILELPKPENEESNNHFLNL